jgi:8-amino-7-oxononanoate synthase
MEGFESLKLRCTGELERLEAQHRRRYLNESQKSNHPVTIDLSHNDYLGLRSNAPFNQAVLAQLAPHPAGSGASRLLGAESRAIEELESKFTTFKGAESALYFPSGYAANEALMTCFGTRHVEVFSDRMNHASIIDGLRLSALPKQKKHIYAHLDLHDLEEKLQHSTAETNLIVTESLFSMDGDIAPLRALQDLAKTYRGLLVVDEAHATGVYGVGGAGLINHFELDHDHMISVNTCGKAMATSGALVCGPNWVRDYLINKARSFIYTTAPSPLLAKASCVSLDFIEKASPQRQHLLGIAHDLKAHLDDLGYNTGSNAGPTSHIIPVILGSDQAALQAAANCREVGVKVLPIRPPTVPEGTARLRVSLNATLDRAQVDQLKRLFENLRRSV